MPDPEASRAWAWVEAAARARDPAFGPHVAEHAAVGAYDVLDYSMQFSATLDEALDHFIRFHRVLCDAWACRREVVGGTARVRRVERTPPPEAEGAIALLVVRARELTGKDVVPHEVRFIHAAPPDTTAHAALFRCPVRFDCAASEVLFDANDLALAIPTANRGLNRVLQRYMTETLARLPKSDSYVDRVRAHIGKKMCTGRPTLGATARDLRASPRTVQRRLGAHGTSHNEVVDAVRREVGERLVAEGRMSMTEIAFLLGFEDMSGFRRSYKRWTGVAPSRARTARKRGGTS